MRVLLLAAALALPSMGCTDGVCPTIVRTAVKSQSKVSDGMRALDEARNVSRGVPMPDDVRRKLEKEITRATMALTEVNGILASTVTACNDPDVDDKFDAFNVAWFAIKNILSLFSESAGYSKYAGPSVVNSQPVPVRVKIQDPFFYQEP